MSGYVPEVFPPIKNISFKAKQNWFGNDVGKHQVRFNTIEDMQLLILNIFVHDFGHDYNFLNESYLKRIVSDARGLLDNFGVGIGNYPLKILFELISGGGQPRYIYNDTKFVNVDKSETEEDSYFNKLLGENDALHNYFVDCEESIPGVGGDASVQSQSQVQLQKVLSNNDNAKGFEVQLQLPLEKVSTGNKNDNQVEVIPSSSSTTKDISEFIKARSNDPDSLAMLSTLKLYITSYLGPNYYTDSIPESVDPKSLAFYKYYMHYSVITTFYGLICYYDDVVEENLVDEKTNLLTGLFSDFMVLLFSSYLKVVESKGGLDYFYSEDPLDPLTILDSSEVIDEFYKGFVEYVKSMEDFEDKKMAIMNEWEPREEAIIGGRGRGARKRRRERERKLREGEGQAEAEVAEPQVAEPQVAEPQVAEPQVAEEPKFRKIYVKRKYGIFHNNLLTTVSRGIFLKTGIWQQIYPPKEGEKAVDFPNPFIYDESSQVTIDAQFEQWRTTQLSMITNITKESLREIFKNDLLIAEILILKHMLIEVLPDFLYLANGIDDKLKGFLDVYLYKCGNYNMSLKPLTNEDEKDKEVIAATKAMTETLLYDYIVPDELGEEGEGEEGGQLGGALNFGKIGNKTLDEPEKFDEEGSEESYPDFHESLIAGPKLKFTGLFKEDKQFTAKEIDRAYEINQLVVQNLRESKIPPITLENGTNGTIVIDNMFDLLKRNTGLIKRVDSDFSYPAPRRRFIYDNASTLTTNVNGLKLFDNKKHINNLRMTNTARMALKDKYPEELKEIPESEIPESETTESLKKDYEDLLQEFRLSQKIFGLYKTLKRGVICAGSSAMDAMDNCSLKMGATEPKEIGSTNYEFVFEEREATTLLSYGGTVLFYRGKNNKGEDNINVHIDFSLKTKLNGQTDEDVAHVIVEEMDIAISEDLKARVAYKSIIERIHKLFEKAFRAEPSVDSSEEFDRLSAEERKEIRNRGIEQMKKLWGFLQYNPYSEKNDVFNQLLGATAIKNLGDLLQEAQGTAQWGGYVNTTAEMGKDVQGFITKKGIGENIIYRSVNEPNVIIPFDRDGNALRFAVEGDRPSAFRAIYFLLFAHTGINLMSMAGYLKGGRSIIVARNQASRNQASSESGSSSAASSESGSSSAASSESGSSSAASSESGSSSAASSVSSLQISYNFDKSVCPPPYGKVIYVISDEKFINDKAVEIKEPKIDKIEKVKKDIDKKKGEDGVSLLKKDMITGVKIPSLSEFKAEKEEKEEKEGKEKERAELFKSMPFYETEGGKTRKHKKPLKKKYNTRNKNKTKKTKKGKKTIKHRKGVQKKHRKTR